MFNGSVGIGGGSEVLDGGVIPGAQGMPKPPKGVLRVSKNLIPRVTLWSKRGSKITLFFGKNEHFCMLRKKNFARASAREIFFE